MSGIIYHAFNTANGKAYVGQTWDSLDERRRGHEKPEGSGARLLTRAIRKYGLDAFVWSVLLAGVDDQKTLDAAETSFICELGCLAPSGYNLKEGGEGGRLSDETRALISNKMKGKPSPHKGKTMSARGRANISAAMSGKSHSPPTHETRLKMRQSNVGKRHKSGWRLSPETRERQRQAALRRWASRENAR